MTDNEGSATAEPVQRRDLGGAPDAGAAMDQAEVAARLRSTGSVFAEEEARLLLDAAQTPEALASSLERRMQGEPLEYILGWVDFGGLRLAVPSGVFVPRQRTLALVDQAAALASAGGLLLDLCCGVGAIAAVLADRVPRLRVVASDLDVVAVQAATDNLAGRSAQVFAGDLFDPLPRGYRGQVDVLTANVPYVPTDALLLLPPEARDHEPRSALDGGRDGLDVARRVISEAPGWLSPGGQLLIEVSDQQAPLAAHTAEVAGLAARIVYDEDRETTVLVATAAGGDRRRRRRR